MTHETFVTLCLALLTAIAGVMGWLWFLLFRFMHEIDKRLRRLEAGAGPKRSYHPNR